MRKSQKIGLALSGGGYRATAYHIGTLKKLHELGLLKDIDILSCISGGSILGAIYGLNKNNFEEFLLQAKKAVKQNVILSIFYSKWFILFIILVVSIGYLLYLVHSILLVLWVLFLLFYNIKLFPISKLVIKSYNRFFFKGKTLSNLPEVPLIAINASNLESGRQFTFSKNKMSDSLYEYRKGDPIYFKQENFPIAKAVAASTCVPHVFTPISIGKHYYQNESDYSKINPLLIDGGLYDNQGIHKLSQTGSSYLCDCIIVSDAGNDVLSTRKNYNQFILLNRSVNYLMGRIKNIQMMNSIYSDKVNDRRVVYQSLQWRVENCIDGFYNHLIAGKIDQSIWKLHDITSDDILEKSKETIISKLKNSIDYAEILKNAPSDEEYNIAFYVSTNLWTLSDKKIDALIKCASSITEIQIKLYCPDLIQ